MTTPVPLVLGTCSLTAAVEMAGLVHLLISVLFVCNADSANAISLAGVMISPLMQCLTAAWFLLGIPVIIIGAVGAIYRVSSSLSLYFGYLVATIIVTLLWMVIFIKYGDTCDTISTSTNKSSFVCDFSNGMAVFGILMLTLCVALQAYMVSCTKDYVAHRLEAELLRYEEPWVMVSQLADDVAAAEARGFAKDSHMTYGASFPAGLVPHPYPPQVVRC